MEPREPNKSLELSPKVPSGSIELLLPEFLRV